MPNAEKKGKKSAQRMDTVASGNAEEPVKGDPLPSERYSCTFHSNTW